MMLASLKSELRKILSVRSTYFVIAFAVIMVIVFGFYTEGLRAGIDSTPAVNPNKLADLFKSTITNLGVFGALVGILSFTHEYRYNTIVYTLTSSKSRTNSLLAKIGSVSLFSLFFTTFVTALAVGLMYLGLAIGGFRTVHQIFPMELIWQVLLVGWGFCMFGLILASLIRQQVGAIAAFFLIPAMIEPLASLLLKDNRIYLPFSALMQVTGNMGQSGPGMHMLTSVQAAAVVGIYMVAGWLIAWVMFLKRDAS